MPGLGLIPLCPAGEVSMIRVALFALLLVTAAAPGATLYVSTEGRAGWSGRLPAPNAQASDGPLLSLLAAREAIRAERAKGVREPFTVLLRGGTYFLTEPLVLAPED